VRANRIRPVGRAVLVFAGPYSGFGVGIVIRIGFVPDQCYNLMEKAEFLKDSQLKPLTMLYEFCVL
jgi:hypothetical protein